MSKRVIFKWLHLSDVHFSESSNTGFNTNELKNSLPDYLKGLGEQKYDCMVISGDYRYAPENVNNPTNVVAYIKRIAQFINIPLEKIIITPGNHDLERSKLREYIAQGVRKDYIPNTGTIYCISELTKDFEFFYKIQDALGTNRWDKSNTNPHVIADMGRCYLLLMNTALTAYGDDHQKLIVGMRYLQNLVDNIRTPKPIILVGHHGLDYFNDTEKRACLTYFRNHNINLYLCGHTHETRYERFDDLVQITTGCLKQDENNVDASVLIGELYADGKVKIYTHYWDKSFNKWQKRTVPNNKSIYERLYDLQGAGLDEEAELSRIEKVSHPFTISKVEQIPPSGDEGVKYIWDKAGFYVESATFNQRVREKPNEDDKNTSAYTISTSIGCILSAMKCQCKFCETGNNKVFMPLTADDIALQCIFMALYDMDCENHPEVHSHNREFAFMGQGEPGYHYDVVKKAILLNDIAMDKLGQNVSRYIISTFGNLDFLSSLIMDTQKGVFGRNKVTVHFSLHAINEDRNKLMPINEHYDYHEFIKLCEKYYRITKEKIGVGILLLDDYKTIDKKTSYSLTEEKLKEILHELNSEVFRIDLCTLNKTSVGRQQTMGANKINKLANVVNQMGFEYKVNKSFGDNINLGCGMLSSNVGDAVEAGDSTIRVFNDAVDCLNQAKQEYEKKYFALS